MNRDPVTLALLAALRTTGFSVGDGQVPKPLPDDEVPYAILEEQGASPWGPPLTAPDSCASLTYTIRCVGRTRQQARMLADRLDAVVLGRSAGGLLPEGTFTTPITVAGHVVGDRRLDVDNGVDREADVFNASRRYVLQVVPA